MGERSGDVVCGTGMRTVQDIHAQETNNPFGGMTMNPHTRTQRTVLEKVTFVGSMVGLAAIAACTGDVPTPPSSVSPGQPMRTLVAPHKPGPLRSETPWRHMTDTELAVKVGEAHGRVFIGFKEPDAAEGVDNAGRVLVSTAAVANAKEQLRALSVTMDFEFLDMPTVVARIPAAMVSQLRQNPLIEYVEPIFPGVRLDQTTPWNIQRVQAPAAWSYSTGSGAKLLIIDSGIQNTHPDLTPAVIQACDGSNGLDNYGHGTNVAGVAAAVNNSIMIVGVAYGVALWTAKDGDGTPDPAFTACGVQFGRVNNVNAINISTVYGSPYTALTDQINAAYNQNGIVVVAAAGNDAGAVGYPASLDAVIAVSATDANDVIASFSNTGSKIELAAPGVSVVTLCLTSTVCAVSGTSFSAPHVAAAAALLKAYNSAWSAGEVRRRLDVGATDLGAPGRDPQYGYGLLNIPAAITAAAVPPPPIVSISGPLSVRANSSCIWSASVTGTPPYTYYWLQNGGVISSESSIPTSFPASWSLFLQVRDQYGQSGSTSVNVTVSPTAPICQF